MIDLEKFRKILNIFVSPDEKNYQFTIQGSTLFDMLLAFWLSTNFTPIFLITLNQIVLDCVSFLS